MDSVLVATIGFVVLFALLAIGLPVGFSMILVGFFGVLALRGFGPAWHVIGTMPFAATSNYAWTVIPLFILMGHFTFHAGIAGDLFKAGNAWLGRLPGAMVLGTIGACAGFAAVTGSSTAEAAVMGKALIPEMKREGYDLRIAAGTVAAAGTLGMLIPPSMVIVIYGVVTETSVGKVLMAGFLPGVMSAFTYMIMVLIWARLNPKAFPKYREVSWRERFGSLGSLWHFMLLVIFVLGGLYLGWFTPTEAGAAGAFGAFVLAVGTRRLGWAALKDALLDAAQTTAFIFLIVVGAYIFTGFLALSRFPMVVSEWLIGLSLHPKVFLLCCMLIYLFFGCFLEAMGTILLTVPVLLPAVVAFGIDPIWFGIFVVMMIEIGMITPPVGFNVFVIQGVVPELSLETVFRGALRFCTVDILNVLIIVQFPIIVLWVPMHM